MKALPYCGSTSEFFRYDSSHIVKLPMTVWSENPNHQKLEKEMERAISFERRVLERLGSHPRIVPLVSLQSCICMNLIDFNRYLGPHGNGILLNEASHGNLQAYIDSNGASINDSLRWKWSLQVVEAVAYVHSKGVIHSDLRPENFLVHARTEFSLDLRLCDFGGARCDELGSNTNHLHDDPFFDPRLPWVPTPSIDIFSLGSIVYTILTGHWPYRTGPPR